LGGDAAAQPVRLVVQILAYLPGFRLPIGPCDSPEAGWLAPYGNQSMPAA